MTDVRRRLRDGTPTQRALGVAAVLAAAWLLLPPTAARLLAIVVVLAAMLAVGRALQRLPTAVRRVWWPIGAAVGLWAAADIGSRVVALTTGTMPALPGTWTLLYPAGTAVFALALLMVGRPTHDEHRGASVDAVIVAISIGIMLWAMVAQPAWDALASERLGAAHLIGFTATNLLLLGALLRTFLLGFRHRGAYRALLIAGVVVAAAGLVVAVAFGVGLAEPLAATPPLWLTVYVLIAAAVTDRSAAQLPRRPEAPSDRAIPIRVGMLAAALLLIPVLQVRSARAPVDLMVAAGTAVLLLLIVLRVWQLLRALSRARQHDLDVRLAAQEARQARRFQALVQHTSDVLIVLDASDRVSYATPSATDLFGTDPTGFTARDVALLLHPDERRATVRALRSRVADRGRRPVTVAVRLLDRDDHPRTAQIVAVDLRDDPDVNGIVLTLQETTQRRELERELRFLAFHDPLTELCNRQLFQDRLEHALSRAGRTNERLAVLLCDLDDFKDVNDSTGHGTGDQLLKVVAERLRQGIRSADTVARLGGDEFAVLVESLDDTRSAVELADRLIEAISEPIDIDGHRLTIGASFGIAIDDGTRTGQELLRDADIAVYAAKTDGKRGWSLHRTTMTANAQARLSLASDLTAAIASDDLEVVFQPIVSLDGLEIHGFEALARWQHPTRGPISPEQFIPIAERNGHIVGLGQLVLSRSLVALRRWLDHADHPDLHTAVNVSSRELHEPGFVGRVDALLRHHGVPPSALVLELTESVLLRDEEAIRGMEQLRRLGVRLAVDDFGTGYSSLGYLRRLPVDILKIDRSFVQEVHVHTEANELVRAIVGIGHSLHLDVIAEGVETSSQLAFLQQLGCPYAQGYRFSRPVHRSEATALLHDGFDVAGPPQALIG